MESKIDISDHISHRYNDELEDLRNQVMEMGGLVERQLQDGLIALRKSDMKLAEKVASADDEVNAKEIAIDKRCTQILVRRQPAASDLRLVLAIIKTINDLERVGDEAEKLGRYAIHLHEHNAKIGDFTEIKHLGKHVREMLSKTLDAFIRMDVQSAIATIQSDDEINEEFDSIMRQLTSKMMEDPRAIKETLRVLWAARALERIGDHAKNICEYTVYLVKGEDVRHTNLVELLEENPELNDE